MSQAGTLLYEHFFKPVGLIKRNGGLWQHILIEQDIRHMKSMSKSLQIPVFEHTISDVTVCGIAGKYNWHQMIFCLYSFFTQLKKNVNTVIIDDGTIDDNFCAHIKNLIPHVQILLHKDTNEIIRNFLHGRHLSACEKYYDKFVVFKKLFHARALLSGHVLLFDADMLFFHYPHEIAQWLQSPDLPVFMHDKYTIYGAQTQYLMHNDLILPNLNTGIIGMDNNAIDWKQIEKHVAAYLQNGPLSYLMEQAVYAMYLQGKPHLRLPTEKYEILPSKHEVQAPKAVMHHYPTEERKWYYRYGWKHIVARQNAE
ncbi:MAG: hypothetical protein NW207_09710 [Cytophagales bacterium]|nr:hypothetical protein [Cytophagales bacterium]